MCELREVLRGFARAASSAVILAINVSIEGRLPIQQGVLLGVG